MEHRTQIHLGHAAHRRAVRYARANGLSLAGLVREAVEEYLQRHEGTLDAAPGHDPIDRLVGLFSSAGRSDGKSIDDEIVEAIEDEVRAAHGREASPRRSSRMGPKRR